LGGSPVTRVVKKRQTLTFFDGIEGAHLKEKAKVYWGGGGGQE